MSEKIPYEQVMERMKSDIGYIAIEAYQSGYKDCETKYCSFDACRNRQAEYQRGLDDAWNAAKKALALWFSDDDSMFGDASYQEFLYKCTASEALAKLKAYEEQQKSDEIKVGDEVRDTSGFMDNAVGYFFGDSSDGCYKVLRYVDGKFKTGIWNKGNFERTGKHSDAVERIVAVMKEGGAE